MSDYPPFLQVGTEISAKFKGAFCEAKIKKASRCVKCRVVFKDVQVPSVVIDENAIRGSLRLGVSVEAPHPDNKLMIPATIQQIKDCSTYTVVFDDGDEKVLRRSQMCLKGGRHFDESESLDVMPLTKPEQFGAPVRSKSANKKGNKSSSDSDSDSSTNNDNQHQSSSNKKSIERRSTRQTPIPPAITNQQAEYGRVVCVFEDAQAVSASSSSLGSKGGFNQEKRKWYPAMIVSPNSQRGTKLKPRDECLVRSFKDGKYQVVSRTCVKDFDIEKAKLNDLPSLKLAIEKAILYLEKDDLPFHWDRELLMGETNYSRSDSGSDEDTASDVDSGGGYAANRPIVSEKKDRFVAQLYKYMDELGTPINKAPVLAQKDLDLYRLFETVRKLGGYNRVCLKNEWKTVLKKLKLDGLPGATHQAVKSAYNKYLSQFDSFYRKLGCQMDETSRRERHASKSAAKINDKVAENVPRNKEDMSNKKPSLMKRTAASRFPSTSSSSKQPTSDTAGKLSQSSTTVPQSAQSSDAGSRDLEKLPASSKSVVVDSTAKIDCSAVSSNLEPEKPESAMADSPQDQTPSFSNEDYKVGQKLKVQYGHGHHGKVYVAKVVKVEGQNRYLVHYLGWNTRYDEIIDGSRVIEVLPEDPSDHETTSSASPKPRSTPQLKPSNGGVLGCSSKASPFDRDRRNTGENLKARKRRSSGGSTHSLVCESSTGKISPLLRKSGKKILRKASPVVGVQQSKLTSDLDVSSETNNQKPLRNNGRRSANSTPVPPVSNPPTRAAVDETQQRSGPRNRRKLSTTERSKNTGGVSEEDSESGGEETTATVRRVSKRLRGEKPSAEEEAESIGSRTAGGISKEEENSNDSFKLLDFSRTESESVTAATNVKIEVIKAEVAIETVTEQPVTVDNEPVTTFNVKEEPANDEIETKCMEIVDDKQVSLPSTEADKRDDTETVAAAAAAVAVAVDLENASEPAKNQQENDNDDSGDDTDKTLSQEISAHVKATVLAVAQNQTGIIASTKTVKSVVAKKPRPAIVRKQKPKRRRRNYSNMVTECRKPNKQTPKKEVESDNEGIAKFEGSPKDPNSLHALRQKIQFEINHDPNYKPFYTFNIIDENLEGEKKIQVLQQRLIELKETYAQVKSEWTYLERKRKKHLEKKRRQQQRTLNANKRTSACDSNEEQRKFSCESTSVTECPAKTSCESRDPTL